MTGTIVIAALAVWAAFHAVRVSHFGSSTGSRLAVVWLATFAFLATQSILFLLERPRRLTPRARRKLDALHVAVLIPAYNEDEGYLRLSLESMLKQTRMPNSVHVVDDGSTQTDYENVRKWWAVAACAAGVHTTWHRIPNGGKRHAQATAVKASPEADVYVTVDSDSCLDRHALEQLLIPLSKPKVMSSAGVIMATNNKGPRRPEGVKALLAWPLYKMMCRVTDLWLVTSQLVDRSSLSAVGSVLVNSGPLAAYRAEIIRDNLDSYLGEKFAGRPVNLSDDSLLTLYALMRGSTRQQPTAFAFSAMPERYSHLHRMYLRWMRGSTIRSLWRLRYLPVTRLAYWVHLSRWFQVALTTIILVWLLLVDPLKNGRYPSALFLVVPFLIGWAQGMRYLTVSRSDESLASRLLTWSMMPVAVIFSWTVLRWLRWYGAATCFKTGWGTRQKGAEVSLGPPVIERQVVGDTMPLRTVPAPGVKLLLDPYAEVTSELEVGEKLRRIPEQA
jgi:hyaluronan synthase